ncbi:MAG: hypothetical protein V4692_07400 [Bdellovibrionota bacterium]
MKTITNKIKSLWNDESAQGATEYILLLVVVVGIAMLFGPKLKGMVEAKVDELNNSVGGFKL